MDRDYFHWGATAEIMEIIRKRRKNPETLRLVERFLEISRPGTMRRNFDMNAQRQIWVPSRPNKRSREEIAEIDGGLLSRANRFGGGYRPLEEKGEEEEEQETQQPEILEEAADAELNRVRDAMRRNEKNTASEAYRTTFEKLSNKWGLTFNDDRIIVPTELRKKLLETLHFGHAGYTKMAAEAKIFWWPNIQK